MMADSRRGFLFTAIALWHAAFLRAQQTSKESVLNAGAPQALTFLSQAQHRVLVRLMDRMIPGDERSSGAVGARVDEYVDFILVHAERPLQDAWREGLDRYGAAIEAKSGAQIDGFLAAQARSEFAPATADERFFVMLKLAVTEGFYTSQEGITKELGYQGMTFDMDASGCTHAEHKISPGYEPLLRSNEKA